MTIPTQSQIESKLIGASAMFAKHLGPKGLRIVTATLFQKWIVKSSGMINAWKAFGAARHGFRILCDPPEGSYTI
jgi:hypothetical protein